MPAVTWLVCFWIPTKVRLIFSDKTNHNTQNQPPPASAVISFFMNSYIWAAAASHKGFGFLLLSVCVTVAGHLPGWEPLYVSHYCGEAQIRVSSLAFISVLRRITELLNFIKPTTFAVCTRPFAHLINTVHHSAGSSAFFLHWNLFWFHLSLSLSRAHADTHLRRAKEQQRRQTSQLVYESKINFVMLRNLQYFMRTILPFPSGVIEGAIGCVVTTVW